MKLKIKYTRGKHLTRHLFALKLPGDDMVANCCTNKYYKSLISAPSQNVTINFMKSKRMFAHGLGRINAHRNNTGLINARIQKIVVDRSC